MRTPAVPDGPDECAQLAPCGRSLYATVTQLSTHSRPFGNCSAGAKVVLAPDRLAPFGEDWQTAVAGEKQGERRELNYMTDAGLVSPGRAAR